MQKSALNMRRTATLPRGPELNGLLGLRSGAAVDDIIKVALLNPVKDVTSNRGKRIRGKLVALSYRLLAEGNTPSRVETVQCRTLRRGCGVDSCRVVDRGRYRRRQYHPSRQARPAYPLRPTDRFERRQLVILLAFSIDQGLELAE